MDTMIKMVILETWERWALSTWIKMERVKQKLREMSIWDVADGINNGPISVIRYVIYIWTVGASADNLHSSLELSRFPFLSTRTCSLQQHVGNVEEPFCGTSYVPRIPFLKMRSSAVNSVLVFLLSFLRFTCFSKWSGNVSQMNASSFGSDLERCYTPFIFTDSKWEQRVHRPLPILDFKLQINGVLLVLNTQGCPSFYWVSNYLVH